MEGRRGTDEESTGSRASSGGPHCLEHVTATLQDSSYFSNWVPDNNRIISLLVRFEGKSEDYWTSGRAECLAEGQMSTSVRRFIPLLILGTQAWIYGSMLKDLTLKTLTFENN